VVKETQLKINKMKKLVMAVLLALFFCLEVTAQQPGDSKPLASNNSVKGQRELMRENRVHQRSQRVLKKNLRHATNRQKDNYSVKFGVKHKKKHRKGKKEKDRSATSGEKPKDE
jgi:hypothetical protein